MGMLVNGEWTHDDDVIVDGAYKRPSSKIRCDDPTEMQKTVAGSPRRFFLIASHSCPWSHRVALARNFLGWEDAIPIHYAHGPRTEGYSINGGAQWTVPGSKMDIVHLHQLYSLHDPEFTGRVTVPVLWDSEQLKIVSNESADLISIFGTNTPHWSRSMVTLRPPHLKGEMADLNTVIYDGLNNGVYRAGFSESQRAYDTAVDDVFNTLNLLDKRLSNQRFIFGDLLTETDIRCLPSLLRFDAIYYILFRCCLRRLIDYKYLSGYARDVYQLIRADQATDFDAMRAASYENDGNSRETIVPIAPEFDWRSPHARADFGQAYIFSSDGKKVPLPAHGIGTSENERSRTLSPISRLLRRQS